MSKVMKSIVHEIFLSFIVAVGSVIVLPRLLDATSSPNYILTLVVFLALSATFIAYETFFRSKS